MSKRPRIIAITGTKGKTTVSRVLNHIYVNSGKTILLVDTDGHYVQGKQKSTLMDSMNLYGLVPTICPGRYLFELKNKSDAIAILEISVGSSGAPGIGYSEHDIGAFLNVYEDHIGRRILTKAQLAKEKAYYIFQRIKPGGAAVFNADDRLVCKNLNIIPSDRDINFLPVGLEFKYFDYKKLLKSGGRAITRQGDYIGIQSKKGFKKIINIKKIPWTFNGFFQPSIYNLMFVAAILYAGNQMNGIRREQIKLMHKYSFTAEGGRLMMLENQQKNLKAILDFAHEKISISQIAKLAKRVAGEKGKTLGVVRLAPDRHDEALMDTGKYIANSFDIIIVYDKIDGIKRKFYRNIKKNIYRKKGEVSGIVFNEIRKWQTGKRKCYRRILEKDAVKLAFAKAGKGDVIVHIVNDDHKKSAKIVKKYLYK